MTKDTTVGGRLRSRIMLFVTLAMVPIGLSGVIQNRQLTTMHDDRVRATLIADSQVVALQEALAWRDDSPPPAEGPLGLINVIIFDRDWTVLWTRSSHKGSDGLSDLSPTIDLQSLRSGVALPQSDTTGGNATWVVVPVVPDATYALVIWNGADGSDPHPQPLWHGLFLPAALWLSSLFMIWLIIERFMIARVARLNRSMMRFSKDRIRPVLSGVPLSNDLGQLEASFQAMADTVLADEARQTDQLEEKALLVKELHHRVKNNLQVINSVLNLQIRDIEDEGARDLLRQTQDRIRGLSAIHASKYETPNLSRIDATALVRTAHAKAFGAGSPSDDFATINLEDVFISTDELVPFAMFVTEALALVSSEIGDHGPNLCLTLGKQADQTVSFHVAIDIAAPTDPVRGTTDALRHRLLGAFANQLDAQFELTTHAGRIELSLQFQTAYSASG